MKLDVEGYQTHWHPEEICEDIPDTPDTHFFYFAWDRLVRLSAMSGARGRVLDVACGNARDITWISQHGWEAVGLDPSPPQLRDARRSASDARVRIHLVQGVAEFLPFKPDAFDSLICKSALDHLVDRDGAMREFARAVRPAGRAVVSVNNYGGLTVRTSRLIYRLLRLVRPAMRQRRFMWDSPVPWQHTYECTYENTRALGAPHFDVSESYGVSFLWGFPGWGRFLAVWPQAVHHLMLRAVNRLARPFPKRADVSVFVWRPRKGAAQATEREAAVAAQRAN